MSQQRPSTSSARVFPSAVPRPPTTSSSARISTRPNSRGMAPPLPPSLSMSELCTPTRDQARSITPRKQKLSPPRHNDVPPAAEPSVWVSSEAGMSIVTDMYPKSNPYRAGGVVSPRGMDGANKAMDDSIRTRQGLIRSSASEGRRGRLGGSPIGKALFNRLDTTSDLRGSPFSATPKGPRPASSGNSSAGALTLAAAASHYSATHGKEWCFLPGDTGTRLTSPRARRANLEEREIQKIRDKRSNEEGVLRAVGHVISDASPDDLPGLTAPLTLRQVDPKTGSILRRYGGGGGRLEGGRSPHRVMQRERYVPIAPSSARKPPHPPTAKLLSSSSKISSYSDGKVGNDNHDDGVTEDVLHSSDRADYARDDSFSIYEMNDDPCNNNDLETRQHSSEVDKGVVLEEGDCVGDPDEMTNDELSRPPSAAPSRPSSAAQPNPSRRRLSVQPPITSTTLKSIPIPTPSSPRVLPESFELQPANTVTTTQQKTQDFPAHIVPEEQYSFRYRAVETTIRQQQDKHSNPLEVKLRNTERILGGLPAPVFAAAPPEGGNKSKQQNNNPQRPVGGTGAGSQLIPLGTDGTNVPTQASSDRNARLLRKKSSMSSLLTRSSSFKASFASRYLQQEDGEGEGGDSLVDLHSHHRRLQLENAHNPVVLSPTRRRARVIAVEPHVGGLLYDQELVRVIAFDPLHSPAASRANTPRAAAVNRRSGGASYGEGGSSGGEGILKVGDVVLYNRQYDYSEDGRYSHHHLYTTGTNTTAIEKLLQDAYSSSKDVDESVGGSGFRVGSGRSTMDESSGNGGLLSSTSIKDIDLWDLSRLDPSVAEVNIVAVRLLVVSSKGANPDGNVPTRASSPPSSPNRSKTHQPNTVEMSSAVGAGAGRSGGLTTVGAILPLSLSEINNAFGGNLRTTTALSDGQLSDCFNALLVGKIGSRSDAVEKGVHGGGGEDATDADGKLFDDDVLCTAIGSLPPDIQVQFELQLLRQLDDLRMIKTTTTPAIGASHLSSHPLLPPTTCSSLLPSKVVGAGLEYYNAIHRLKVEQLVQTRAALLTHLEEFVDASITSEHDGACRASDLDSSLGADCRSGSYEEGGGCASSSLLVPTNGRGGGKCSRHDRIREVQRRAAVSLHQAIMGQMTAEQIAEGGHNIFMAIQHQQLVNQNQNTHSSVDDEQNASIASGVMSTSTTLFTGGSPTSTHGGGKHYHSTRRSIADSLTGEQKRKSLRLLLRNDEAVNQEISTAPPTPAAARTASHHHHTNINMPHRLSIHNFTSPTTVLSSRHDSHHHLLASSSIASSQWPSFAHQSSSAPLLAAEARRRTVLHKEGDTDGVFSNPFGTSQGLAELLLVHTQLNPYAIDIGANIPPPPNSALSLGGGLVSTTPRTIFDNVPEPRISAKALKDFQKAFVGDVPKKQH